MISDQAAIAESHAGTDQIKFAVFGHREEIEALCMRQGWIYIDEGKLTWGKRESHKADKLKALERQVKVEAPKKTMSLEAWL
jgi:hypothetical protein